MTSTCSTSRLTENLRNALLLSRTELDAWVEREKARADAAAEQTRQTHDLLQHEIDKKVTALLSLQLESGMNIKESRHDVDDDIAQEQEVVRAELANLRSTLPTKQDRIQDLRMEQAHVKGQVREMLEQQRSQEEAQQHTLDNLTTGLLRYKALGLDFSKADNNCLKFCMTLIDRNEPTREFWFTLGTNERDEYYISHCQPALPMRFLIGLTQDLTRTDDMSALVRSMRQAFRNLVQQDE